MKYSRETKARHYSIYYSNYDHTKEKEYIEKIVGARGNSIAWFRVEIPEKVTQGSDGWGDPF